MGGGEKTRSITYLDAFIAVNRLLQSQSDSQTLLLGANPDHRDLSSKPCSIMERKSYSRQAAWIGFTCIKSLKSLEDENADV